MKTKVLCNTQDICRMVRVDDRELYQNFENLILLLVNFQINTNLGLTFHDYEDQVFP